MGLESENRAIAVKFEADSSRVNLNILLFNDLCSIRPQNGAFDENIIVG